MATDYPRDMVGYGAAPPFADWPGGVRLALNIVFNLEEGSEYSVPDGDGFSETGLTEIRASTYPLGSRDFAANRSSSTAAASGSGACIAWFRNGA